ncbi:MAG TPA: hypothetical protein VNX87_29800 [Candidatus Sulfotelmatobacter sp.]|nr:hypothetical protein [Candidatus Sulfotelmatobacter sp.]
MPVTDKGDSTRLRMMMLEELQRAATTCEIATRTYLRYVTAFANFDACRQTKKHNQWPVTDGEL